MKVAVFKPQWNTYGICDLTKIGMDYSQENQNLHQSPGATEVLWVNGSGVFGGIDGGFKANPQGLKAAQPLSYISAQTPPFLIMHGDSDKIVSPGQSDLLYDALKAKGIPATLYKIKGASHGGNAWVQPEIVSLIIDFF
jgi:dipeptidyl aminopeptidase/acylaminoacyl peptidase